MEPFRLLVPATDENFDETCYLAANPDVAAAFKRGELASGRVHFDAFGAAEGRALRRPVPQAMKATKLDRVRPLLRRGALLRDTATVLDCLPIATRLELDLVATANVSNHEYDEHALAIIERHAEGLVLDCGAGLRNTYFPNVVNYEIVEYDSTDVLGAAERLPFEDETFDAVLSLNVLEHVKDPFAAASEIMRVMKPGAELMAVAPFLQPAHGYPHHYYNMTAQGLANLFSELENKRAVVYGAMRPIWAVNWMLEGYASALPPADREAFGAMQVDELLAPPAHLETLPIAANIPDDRLSELASAHALFARRATARPIIRSHGHCPLCDRDVEFVAWGPWLRDHLLCSSCGSVPRERALIQTIETFFPRWREAVVHESSPAKRGASEHLAQGCPKYIPTQYFPDRLPGSIVGDIRCENLERLSFADASIDLHVTQDVLEHVFDPYRAFQEISRTLKPGGMHIFTVPLVNKGKQSKRRARLQNGDIVHLAKESYHGSPVGDGRALVTIDWGFDICRHIFEACGLFTHIVQIDDMSKGIRAEYIDVLVTVKPLATAVGGGIE